jgi:hypothetical protein
MNKYTEDQHLKEYAQQMFPDYEILSVYWTDITYNGEDLLQIEMRAPGAVHMVRIEGVLTND